MIHKNPKTTFSRQSVLPDIDTDAYVHPLAAVIGHVNIEKQVFIAPFASVRGDEGHPLFIGAFSNVQDGVIIHALKTESHGTPIPENTVTTDNKTYAVYIGNNVSLAHQCQIHGPAQIDSNTFVGMKSLVFKSTIGTGCVIEPGCILMNITVNDGCYIPAGSTITTQQDADKLPLVDDNYHWKEINDHVVAANIEFAQKYKNLDI